MLIYYWSKGYKPWAFLMMIGLVVFPVSLGIASDVSERTVHHRERREC